MKHSLYWSNSVTFSDQSPLQLWYLQLTSVPLGALRDHMWHLRCANTVSFPKQLNWTVLDFMSHACCLTRLCSKPKPQKQVFCICNLSRVTNQWGKAINWHPLIVLENAGIVCVFICVMILSRFWGQWHKHLIKRGQSESQIWGCSSWPSSLLISRQQTPCLRFDGMTHWHSVLLLAPS